MTDRSVCANGCGKEWVGTTNRRAQTPLDPNATRTANEATWSNCARLTSADGGRRQLTMADDDASCRRVWMDAYLEALAKDKPKTPPRPKVDPKATVPPCQLANLVVRVTDDKGNRIENAIVNVDGVGAVTTDKDGYADFGQVAPRSYEITAEKDHHSPAPGQDHGPSKTTKDVPRCATIVADLQLVATCKSIYLKKPFLIAKATDNALATAPAGTLNATVVNDDIFSGATMDLGQDITHSSGRAAPGGESVGTTVAVLDAKMRALLRHFAAKERTGMTQRLFDSFLAKNSSVLVFTDSDLDAAMKAHPNVVSFANRTLAAPGTPGIDPTKTRIDQALKAAGWDVNSVTPITDLGVPAFNLGTKALGTKDFGNGLGVMVNAIAYVLVFVQAYEYHSCTEEYKIKLKFAVYDVFGLDDDDLSEYGADSDWAHEAYEGITAWWQLQHQFDFTPLITRGVVEMDFTVSTSGR